MSQNLQEFVKELHQTVDAFEKDWMKNHQETPDAFPLAMEEGNEGAWYEMFRSFYEDGDE